MPPDCTVREPKGPSPARTAGERARLTKSAGARVLQTAPSPAETQVVAAALPPAVLAVQYLRRKKNAIVMSTPAAGLPPLARPARRSRTYGQATGPTPE